MQTSPETSPGWCSSTKSTSYPLDYLSPNALGFICIACSISAHINTHLENYKDSLVKCLSDGAHRLTASYVLKSQPDRLENNNPIPFIFSGFHYWMKGAFDKMKKLNPSTARPIIESPEILQNYLLIFSNVALTALEIHVHKIIWWNLKWLFSNEARCMMGLNTSAIIEKGCWLYTWYVGAWKMYELNCFLNELSTVHRETRMGVGHVATESSKNRAINVKENDVWFFFHNL